MGEKNLMPYWKTFLHPVLKFLRVCMPRIEVELTNLCLDFNLLGLNSYTCGPIKKYPAQGTLGLEAYEQQRAFPTP